MQAGIFDPYVDTLGGGERYCLTLAEALLVKGWRVDLFWPDQKIKEKLRTKFNLNLDGLNPVDYSPLKNNLLQRQRFENDYDFLFYLTDGSVPFMFGRKNILHFQVPFRNIPGNDLVKKIKLMKIAKVVCNSFFTKRIIDSSLGVSSELFYPPVDVARIKPGDKENIILSVGRFSQLLQNKRQDILIKVFQRLIDEHDLRGWQLILAGGSEIGGENFVKYLRNLAEGYPIAILENPPFKKLVDLYGKAKFFWVASGYGIDEITNPEKVEHFGISTVEAMAAGCVPIVQAKGGQKEIVESGKSGFFWEGDEELISRTRYLIGHQKTMQKISGNAILRSSDFSKEIFSQKIFSLLK